MSYLLKFGSYTFQAGFSPADDSLERAIPVGKLPRADGARVLTAYAKEKVCVVHGGIIKGPMDTSDFRTRLDALKVALAAGPSDLYFGDSDRFYRCMQASLRLPYGPTAYGRMAVDCVITFTGPDPRALSTTQTTDTWSSPTTGTTHVVAAGGDAYADAKIACTIGGSGTVSIDFTITNNTTGKSFRLMGSVTGGDVIEVDCLEKTVEISGVDKTNLMVANSRFLTLNVGNNTLQYDTTTGTVTSIVTTFRARYW